MFKSGSRQKQIIEQNYEIRYKALYYLIAARHPINSFCPSTVVQSTLFQLVSQLLTHFFYQYSDFLSLRACLADNPSNLSYALELDKYFYACILSQSLFTIANDNYCSTDTIILTDFTSPH